MLVERRGFINHGSGEHRSDHEVGDVVRQGFEALKGLGRAAVGVATFQHYLTLRDYEPQAAPLAAEAPSHEPQEQPFGLMPEGFVEQQFLGHLVAGHS